MIRRLVVAAGVTTILLGVYTACVGDDPDPAPATPPGQGAQKQACFANGTCLSPLVCIAGICEIPDAATGGASSSSSSSSSGAASSSGTSSGNSSSSGSSSSSNSSGTVSSASGAPCVPHLSDGGPSCKTGEFCQYGDRCCMMDGTCTAAGCASSASSASSTGGLWMCDSIRNCPPTTMCCIVTSSGGPPSQCGDGTSVFAIGSTCTAVGGCNQPNQIPTCEGSAGSPGCTKACAPKHVVRGGSLPEVDLYLCGP